MIIHRKNNWAICIYIVLIISLLCPQLVKANDKPKKKLKYRISFNYYKSANGEKTLEARLFYKAGRKFVNVQDEYIGFYLLNNDEEVLLAQSATNADGEAILLIDAGYPLSWDSTNTCNFVARFKGNDIARKAKKEISIVDINIGIDFVNNADEKTVTVLINSISPTGESIPIEDAEVYGYVERMFSLLPFGEGFSDSEGQLVFDFPNELPGDSIGNLNVIVKIVESDDYGTVEMNETINWGVKVDYLEQQVARSLWTDDAPVWMSITVIIILAGVWVNFLLAIFKIVKIKKLGMQASSEANLS